MVTWLSCTIFTVSQIINVKRTVFFQFLFSSNFSADVKYERLKNPFLPRPSRPLGVSAGSNSAKDLKTNLAMNLIIKRNRLLFFISNGNIKIKPHRNTNHFITIYSISCHLSDQVYIVALHLFMSTNQVR